jgi:hypothetical protein
MNFALKTLPLQTLRAQLRSYQKRLKAGDKLPTINALSAMAGVHRDTIYALIVGKRINERSRYAISKALTEVMQSQWNQPSRLLSIEFGIDGPRLKFGFVDKNIFSRR